MVMATTACAKRYGSSSSAACNQSNRGEASRHHMQEEQCLRLTVLHITGSSYLTDPGMRHAYWTVLR